MESNYEKKSTKMNLQAKQEGDVSQSRLFPKPTSSSRQWSAFRNPRIVRVSRSFGGKDRHSKVCTIRGLRDRRIRLSVPTAIQLYDLQDKLGLGQPSKVIDWLLDVTKNDIDNLPPLQIPLGFDQFHQQMFNPPHNYQSSSIAPFYDQNLHSSLAEKEKFKLADAREIMLGDSSRTNKEVNYDQGGNFNSSSLLNNGLPFYNWDPSSLSLASSQYGQAAGLPPSSNSSFGSQLLFSQAPTNMNSLFPTYAYESRPSNNFQWLSSGSLSHHQFLPNTKTFSLNENPENHHDPGT